MNKSGTSAADTLRKVHDLYKSKHVKGCNFYFEHCWNLLKEHPKWADGWSQVKPPTAKRKALSTNQDSDCVEVGASLGLEGAASMEQSVSTGRPGGTKAAKAVQKARKVREAAIYAQAEATKTMAAAQMRKVALLEQQNLIMLMTMPDNQDATPEAREFLQLLRAEEMRKLKRRLAEDEERERLQKIAEEEQAAALAKVLASEARAQSPTPSCEEDGDGDLNLDAEDHERFSVGGGSDFTAGREGDEIVGRKFAGDSSVIRGLGRYGMGDQGDVHGLESGDFEHGDSNHPWNDLEHVDPCQPTQFQTLGVHAGTRLSFSNNRD